MEDKGVIMETKETISIRSFVSLLLTSSFIMLALSGIVLYVAPQCRVADIIEWRTLGLAKDQWASVHMTAAFVFLILAVIHLVVYNWKRFVAYLKPGRRRILALRPELLYSLLVAVVLLAGAALLLPPFNLLPDTHEAIQLHYRENSGIDERDGRGRGRGGRSRLGWEDTGWFVGPARMGNDSKVSERRL